jgi:Flp pilus assembly protein TadD
MFAQGLVKEKKFDEAIALLERALVPDPENKLGLVTLGRAYTGAKKLEEARRAYRRAADLYPDDEEVHRLLGTLLLAGGEVDSAVDLMAGLVHQSPRSAQAHYLYGMAWFYARKWDRAIEALGHATELGRSFARSWYLLAICYEQAGRRDEALAAVDGYLKREPNVESLLRDPLLAKLRESPEFRRIIRRYL